MSGGFSQTAPLHFAPFMKRIVILVSGRGSNMQAIVRACQSEQWQAQVVGVLSNRPDAEGLAWAQAAGLPTLALDHRAYAGRDAFDAALAEAIDAWAPDLVVLAGFMRILGDAFVQRFAGRLVNVHPSLLPAFTGLHTHQRAIAAGCKLAGATVHFVTPALDHGPIIAQAAVPVLPGDTPESLSARVLEAEHVIYPRAVRWFVEGQLAVEQGVVRHLADEPQFWLA
jgi:phosphoribosylglycinamide formyltransferase 1